MEFKYHDGKLSMKFGEKNPKSYLYSLVNTETRKGRIAKAVIDYTWFIGKWSLLWVLCFSGYTETAIKIILLWHLGKAVLSHSMRLLSKRHTLKGKLNNTLPSMLSMSILIYDLIANPLTTIILVLSILLLILAHIVFPIKSDLKKEYQY